MKREFWFLVGSQCLYGDDVLREVAIASRYDTYLVNKPLKFCLTDNQMDIYLNKNKKVSSQEYWYEAEFGDMKNQIW